ncbi:MAG: lipopolysaccharide heptosyltransferase II [Bacteroidetes bacterium]|nr:lipopolysaccharide heptosyltransferase II [Bacteroidota bacterium]
MSTPDRILVFQTAFLGDVILTTPMLQLLRERFPSAVIDVVTTPAAAPFLVDHPAVTSVIPFDKRKSQKGLRGILALAIMLRQRQYQVAVVPHRSFRTALIMALSRIPRRITFNTSSGTMFYHDLVPYERTHHESARNISLLSPLGISADGAVLPSLHPSASDVRTVATQLFQREILEDHAMIAIAPGSVWNTKRWPADRFAGLARRLAEAGFQVMIIGGKDDAAAGAEIRTAGDHKNIHDMTGRLTLMQSAELIRRSRLLVTNDSAPLHIGVAMRTPVVALFGATVPAFGFGPYGPYDRVVETNGLSCRPCAIHGGKKCPIGTFDCMLKIEAGVVFTAVTEVLAAAEAGRR